MVRRVAENAKNVILTAILTLAIFCLLALIGKVIVMVDSYKAKEDRMERRIRKMTYKERSVLYCILMMDFARKEVLENYVQDVSPTLKALKKKGYIKESSICLVLDGYELAQGDGYEYMSKYVKRNIEAYCLTDKGKKLAMAYNREIIEMIRNRKEIERKGLMTFGEALELLKKGRKVARRGWNGKGLWLELQRPDENSKMTLPYVYLNYPSGDRYHNGGRVPWIASQTDMLEEDWVEVE